MEWNETKRSATRRYESDEMRRDGTAWNGLDNKGGPHQVSGPCGGPKAHRQMQPCHLQSACLRCMLT
eukprot:scaffold160805_cov25-Prasinocladus_malaysianus.AAC.1